MQIPYDDAPFGRFHVRLAIAGSGGVFSDGYGLGIIGIALAGATPRLGLTPLWEGLLGGASLLGLFAGALFTGPAADRFGRRPVFAWNMVLLGLLSLSQGFAQTAGALLGMRLMLGVLLGTDYVVSKALLTEFMPRSRRGRVLGLLSIAWAGGYACAYFVGFALTRAGPDAWRWMLISSAVPCLLMIPLRWGTPESPLWLASHGRHAAAAYIVRVTLGADVAPPAAPAPGGPSRRVRGRWAQLFSPAWRRRTLVGCAFFTGQVIPYFAVGTFVAQVMSAMSLSGGYVGGLIYNLSLIGGAVGGLLVVDRISRRRFLLGSFGISALALLILALWTHAPAVPTFVLFAVFAGVLSAASNLVYVYLPELFPTDLRASGIGLSIAVSRTGSAVSTFFLPIVMAAYGARVALGGCVAVLALAAAICHRWAPETKDLRLSLLDHAVADGAAGS